MAGSIRAREARQVLQDILRNRKVPPSVWSCEGDRLHFMIQGRIEVVSSKRGATFYELQERCRKLHALCDEYDRANANRGQIDLETYLASTASAQ